MTVSDSPKFSVLITVYNVEKYLRECLDSVAAQSFSDFEAVVVDDGSDDASGKIADEYAAHDGRFHVYHTKNRGVLLARRLAAEKSVGQYLLNIDADDILERELLQCVHSRFLTDGSDMVFYDFNVFFPDGTRRCEKYFPENRVFCEKDRAELFGLLLTTRFNSLCIKCFSREIADIALNYDTFAGLSHGEDLLQSSYLVCASEKTSYENRALYNYRAGFGASSRFERDTLERVSGVVDVISSLMTENGFESESNSRELHAMCRKLVNNYLGLMAKNVPCVGECTRLLRSARCTTAYRLSLSRVCDGEFSREQNLKFSLLRHGMIRAVVLLQKIKAVS